MNINRPMLYRAAWPNVLRLARALGLEGPLDDCSCVRCRMVLIEGIIRRL